MQNDDFQILGDFEGYGSVFLTRNWNPDYLEKFRRSRASILRLDGYSGSATRDLSFLLDLPLLRGVQIGCPQICDVSPINFLSDLEVLSLDCKAATPIGFQKFKNLKRIFLTWRPAYRSLFEVTTLHHANIIGFPATSLEVWKRNPKLKELKISSPKLESLAGVEGFPVLEKLDLFRCRKLKSLEALRGEKSLKYLEIGQCPSGLDLGPIGSLRNLETLILDNCKEIETIAPLVHCKKLAVLQISCNTKILDGQFGCLKSLKNLVELRVRRHKHYVDCPQSF